MTAAKGRARGRGSGLNFSGSRAREMLARLKALRREQREKGRLSIFDVPEDEE